MDIERFLETVASVSADVRKEYHVTLGELIAFLEAAPPDMPIRFDNGSSPSSCKSYRGYYSDLAFANGGPIIVREFLPICKLALGAGFKGYKGGDYIMEDDTPLWQAEWGKLGEAIVSVAIVDAAAVLGRKFIG